MFQRVFRWHLATFNRGVNFFQQARVRPTLRIELVKPQTAFSRFHTMAVPAVKT
jgi:hypothetical protein